MQAYLALTRRELAGYFMSLTGYLIMAAAMFLMGFSFVVLLVKLRQDPTPMPLTELFYITPFFWLILLLSVPVITMRLFAQEKASGTFETLMTTPVSDLHVVLAKFSAALFFTVSCGFPCWGACLSCAITRATPQRWIPGCWAERSLAFSFWAACLSPRVAARLL
jgi:ABC-2 type transport system permease protein